jgi:hypothetical protein
VGTEAGTVGTAIDQRLRLAFTTAEPVDEATRIGMLMSRGERGSKTGETLFRVGVELRARMTEVVQAMDLDDRGLPLERTWEEEERLSRLLLAAAWYQLAARTLIGFTYTPLFLAAHEDPGAFTLDRLLALPHRDMVADVAAQACHAEGGPLVRLRASTTPELCRGGPTFPAVDITADADLLIDGMLVDFKSTRRPAHLPQSTALQLVGYLLLDGDDRYGIDALGLYLTRSGVLASWPVEEYLALLGARRRDLTVLRSAVAQLLADCEADQVPFTPDEEHRVHRLLERLAAVVPTGGCPACAQPLPAGARPGSGCSRWCRTRLPTLRRKGWATS